MLGLSARNRTSVESVGFVHLQEVSSGLPQGSTIVLFCSTELSRTTDVGTKYISQLVTQDCAIPFSPSSKCLLRFSAHPHLSYGKNKAKQTQHLTWTHICPYHSMSLKRCLDTTHLFPHLSSMPWLPEIRVREPFVLASSSFSRGSRLCSLHIPLELPLPEDSCPFTVLTTTLWWLMLHVYLTGHRCPA